MVKISKAVKDATWKKYMGYNTEGKCYCCKMETISVFNFEVGHNKAKSKGGSNDIENLRPICKGCNTSMGTQSIESFRAKHFSSNTDKLPSSNKGTLSLKRKSVKKNPLSRQSLNELTLKQLKFLANKHKIKVQGITYDELFFGTKVGSHTKPPTRRQYINKLFGIVLEGEKLQ